MRTLLLVACLSMAAACGDEKEKAFFDPRPVDGPYRVSVHHVKNTCGSTRPDPDARPFVDLLLRDDGLYDLRHNSLDIPGEFTVLGIDRTGGNVHHDHSWAGGSTDYRIRIDGIVTPDEMDLTFTFDGYPNCRITRQLVGAPWPLHDPEDLEGFYTITQTPTGNTCDGTQRQTGIPRTAVMTSVIPHGATMFWLSAPGWTVNPDLPDQDGMLDWRGTLQVDAGFTTLPFQATLKGRFGPQEVASVLSVWALGTEPETTTCAEEHSLVGAKLLPDLSAVDNDYRGHYDIHDGGDAAPGDEDSALDSTARIVTQPDGTLAFVDPFTSMPLTLHDGVIHGRIGSPPEGGMVTVDGELAPPYLSYTITYDRFGTDGLWQCSATVVSSDMHVRYVFE